MGAREAANGSASSRLHPGALQCSRGAMEKISDDDATKLTVGAGRRGAANHRETPLKSFDLRGVLFESLAVTYSSMASGHTTIGAERFHFRVRNGIGWFPLAIAARQTV